MPGGVEQSRVNGPTPRPDVVLSRPTRRPSLDDAAVTAIPGASAWRDPRVSPRTLDDESRQWLRGLLSDGRERDDAIHALLELLQRGAWSEARRRAGALPRHVVDDLDDLASQAADDAAAAVLRKIDDYRGESRFTTWAYKFVIFEVSSALRREAWRGRQLPAGDELLGNLRDDAPIDPESEVEARLLLAAIEGAMSTELTPWQRRIFTAVVISHVPIDVLADRHSTTRGAVYKVLHDARRKLRAALRAQGWDVEGGEGSDERTA